MNDEHECDPPVRSKPPDLESDGGTDDSAGLGDEDEESGS